MAYADIKPGKYIARPVQGLFTESPEKKTPCVAVEFQFEIDTLAGKSTETLWWQGWFSEKSLERTMEALVVMGFLEDAPRNADQSFGNTNFIPGSEVQITIENEPYTDKNGAPKDSMKIKWVNKVGGSQFAVMDSAAAAAMVKSIDLKTQMAAARAALGLKKPATPAANPRVKNYAPGADNSEIPF